MADQKPTPAPAAGAEEKAAPKQKKSLATIGLVVGVMLVEGVAIFGVMKIFGSDADPTLGMGMDQATTNPWEEFQEIEVARLRVENTNGTRTTLYNVRFVVTVHTTKAADFKLVLEQRKFTIEDALSRVVQEASEREMSEPGKETLKEKVRFELGKILRDTEIIEDVLIPELIALPTGL